MITLIELHKISLYTILIQYTTMYIIFDNVDDDVRTYICIAVIVFSLLLMIILLLMQGII